jgi:hypothetical protein
MRSLKLKKKMGDCCHGTSGCSEVYKYGPTFKPLPHTFNNFAATESIKSITALHTVIKGGISNLKTNLNEKDFPKFLYATPYPKDNPFPSDPTQLRS